MPPIKKIVLPILLRWRYIIWIWGDWSCTRITRGRHTRRVHMMKYLYFSYHIHVDVSSRSCSRDCVRPCEQVWQFFSIVNKCGTLYRRKLTENTDYFEIVEMKWIVSLFMLIHKRLLKMNFHIAYKDWDLQSDKMCIIISYIVKICMCLLGLWEAI